MQEKQSKLKALRLKKGISQLELSKASEVKLRSIREYENQHRDISGANIATIVKLSEALDVPFYELLTPEARANAIANINKYHKPEH